MEDITCCIVSCEKPIDENYWNNQYQNHTTGWDLGEISPPIKTYINTLTNKSISILIPGCGNTYEADYLLQEGFTNITVIDIAPTLVEVLQQKFIGNKNINVLLGDFFKHQGTYDVIIEQTFFCALPPTLRQKYVYKMHQLLANNGLLVGLLFNKTFEKSPPFGGSKEEYLSLFKNAFHLNTMATCTNSIMPRANTELWVELQKNKAAIVTLYSFKGMHCSSCQKKISEKLSVLPNVLNVSISSNYAEILIVSTQHIQIKDLQNTIAFDTKYSINL
jgi:SAM-dependent methyltransferase